MLVTLGDAGPPVALIDADDPHHHRCTATLGRLPKGPLVVTWPCLTEAMYLLGWKGGHATQDQLWEFLADGLILPYINAPTNGRGCAS